MLDPTVRDAAPRPRLGTRRETEDVKPPDLWPGHKLGR